MPKTEEQGQKKKSGKPACNCWIWKSSSGMCKSDGGQGSLYFFADNTVLPTRSEATSGCRQTRVRWCSELRLHARESQGKIANWPEIMEVVGSFAWKMSLIYRNQQAEQLFTAQRGLQIRLLLKAQEHTFKMNESEIKITYLSHKCENLFFLHRIHPVMYIFNIYWLLAGTLMFG